MKHAWSSFLSLGAAFAIASGCSAGTNDSGDGVLVGGGGAGNAGNANTGGNLFGGPGANGPGGDQAVGGGFGQPIGRDDPDGGCPRVVQKAEKQLGGKADIIFVIDSSGSMFDETTGIQQNMNTFSSFITGTGIDAHVVVVGAAGPPLLGFIPPYGVCVAPPLGSGAACPGDTNPPVYTHIIDNVDSHNALGELINTYPQWSGALRADASKHFVVVTDDAANPTPTEQDFTSFFNQQFAGALWRFDGVFCGPQSTGVNCSGNGVTYLDLVTQTGGIYSDLAAPDWNAIFQNLGQGVVADAKPVDCEWTIPPPPDGSTFNANKVNVEFTPTSGVVETIYGVANQGECQDPVGGWFFDDPNAPSKVIACPASCTKMQADQNARVDVVFGCDTKHPPAR
ncbi:MAG TPA: hypothetical protein VHE30_24355 [Polyangiaceae bacterium]|nr:hypothetical protein [Polyangiaceae bacterium]